MATYKIPQDVEADDKLLGPFTFKQFIFLIGLVLSGFITFQLSRLSIAFAIPLMPVVLIFAVLGLYRPADQPIENKLLAYVNFYFKPHRRIWSRDGIVEHVHITAPKKVETHYTDHRTQDQVRSQLQQLAQIVDTRGWSTKRPELQIPDNPAAYGNASDRIVQPHDLSRLQQDAIEVHEYDDVYQEGSPVTESFDQLSEKSTDSARQAALARMQAARSGKEDATQAPPPPQPPTHNLQPQTPQPYTSQQNKAGFSDDNLTVGNPAAYNPHYEPFPHMHQRVISPDGSGFHDPIATNNSDGSQMNNDYADNHPLNDDANNQPEPSQVAQAKAEHEQKIKEYASSDLPVSTVAERAKNDPTEQVMNIDHNS